MYLISSYPKEIFEIAYNFRGGETVLNDLTKEIYDMSLYKSEDSRNKFKGDMFEIFAWTFFAAFSNDPSVGLLEYKPINIEEDYGVDGTGTNANGDSVAVQVKYKSNPTNLVSYTDIAKTYTSGQIMLNLDLGTENSIYVFTNSKGVTPACKSVFGNIVKVLDGNNIDHYVRNNVNFWKFFYDEIYNYLNE